MAQDFVIAQLYWGRTFMPDPQHQTDPGAGLFNWMDMSGAISAMCNSPYFGALTQYGVGQVIPGGPLIDVAPDEPPSQWSDGTQADGFADQDIENFLIREIDSGRQADPTSWQDGERAVYVVILKQGLFSKDHFTSAVGFHWHFTYKGTPAICAWVMQGGSLHDTTKIVSHEVVEATSSELGAGELGDGCEQTAGIVNGVMVQGYLSIQDGGQCVIPGELVVGGHHFPGDR